MSRLAVTQRVEFLEEPFDSPFLRRPAHRFLDLLFEISSGQTVGVARMPNCSAINFRFVTRSLPVPALTCSIVRFLKRPRHVAPSAAQAALHPARGERRARCRGSKVMAAQRERFHLDLTGLRYDRL